VLFDSNNHVKLNDFDCFIKVKKRLDFGTEPFIRLLSKKKGQDRRTYKKARPYIKQFALSLVIYFLI
jgi:hypothetical protein